ncbi:MAG TPA: PDZ domain-containing protein [Gemmatimonadales bacterium]|nr:PDZ domain-containing protein [Gemmatimonadales bacterium]
MRRQLFTSTLMLLPVVAVAAGAQEPRRLTERREIIFATPQGTIDLRRARMGVTVSLRADSRDSIGALVVAVTPGGPADRAGVRANDIITRMNGVRLATGPRDEADGDESRPGRRLINLASRLDPGDTVRLEVNRDGRILNFTLVAEESDLDRVIERGFPGGRIEIERMMPGIRLPLPDERRMRVFAFGAGGISDLELVRVSPELAQGLGISEGLLVVSVGADTALGLRAGDVILSIGGRRPTDPAHAMRILSTYDRNEQIQFEIMRQRQRRTVTGRLPERGGLRWRVEPNSFEFVLPEVRSKA